MNINLLFWIFNGDHINFGAWPTRRSDAPKLLVPALPESHALSEIGPSLGYEVVSLSPEEYKQNIDTLLLHSEEVAQATGYVSAIILTLPDSELRYEINTEVESRLKPELLNWEMEGMDIRKITLEIRILDKDKGESVITTTVPFIVISRYHMVVTATPEDHDELKLLEAAEFVRALTAYRPFDIFDELGACGNLSDTASLRALMTLERRLFSMHYDAVGPITVGAILKTFSVRPADMRAYLKSVA